MDQGEDKDVVRIRLKTPDGDAVVLVFNFSENPASTCTADTQFGSYMIAALAGSAAIARLNECARSKKANSWLGSLEKYVGYPGRHSRQYHKRIVASPLETCITCKSGNNNRHYKNFWSSIFLGCAEVFDFEPEIDFSHLRKDDGEAMQGDLSVVIAALKDLIDRKREEDATAG